MMPLAALALAGCLTVPAGSDRITAGDLAPAFPALAGVAPDTEIGLAPSPGVARIFRAPELRRISARFNLTDTPETDICIERSIAVLDPARLLAAMQKELPGAQIRILDFSRQLAPQGDIEFHRSTLRSNSPAGAMWNGAVRYAGNRRFTIWARVQITAPVTRVLAIGDLPAGSPVEAGQLVLRNAEEFPLEAAFAQRIEDVLGKVPRASIRAGTAIRLDALENPKDVMRGDVVEVEVQSGAARLKLEARAETSASLGQTVQVRNPLSNKLFAARVAGKDKVSVNNLPGR